MDKALLLLISIIMKLTQKGQGGEKLSPLPDFYIGAHAEVNHLQVLTRDPRLFRLPPSAFRL
jgi:predicted nucleic acid-binding protein